MILVDNRVGSKELLTYIQRIAYTKADHSQLEFGDACFEGNGPDGRICIGVERKKLSDMLNCIDDSRYSAHQLPGMRNLYQHSILMVEGVWKPDIDTGYMMECVAQMTWRPFRYRASNTRYSKLFRYLMSIQMSGVAVITTRDIEQTAYNICESFAYFNKKWEDHTSLLQKHKLNIPSLVGKPSLTYRVAAELEGVGVKLAGQIAKKFSSLREMANADETEFVVVEGVGVKLARRIVRELNGNKE